MAEQPFLLSPLLSSNSDVMNLYASLPGKGLESVAIKRPATLFYDFRDDIEIKLYTITDFPMAAKITPASGKVTDKQGRVFWPVRHAG
jgi:hypothetical protein